MSKRDRTSLSSLAAKGAGGASSSPPTTEAKRTKKNTTKPDAENMAAKGNNNNNNNEPMELDEDLHSRQLAVYGRDAMRKLAQAKVLISGMNGLGIEVAKNVSLAGVSAITIHDTIDTDYKHLSSQFYLTEANMGTNRAAACAEKLQDLNPSVDINVDTRPVEQTLLDAAFLSQFNVVVLAGDTCTAEQAVQCDNICHNAAGGSIPFIKAETRGVFGTIFTDFGPTFHVSDADGELPHTEIVASISEMDETTVIVTNVEDERLEFEDGEYVTFSEVKGMTQLNDGVARKVKNCKPHSFEVELGGSMKCSDLSPYESGGLVAQAKQPKTVSFKTLAAAKTDPGEFLLCDFAKFTRPGLLHLAFLALDTYRSQRLAAGEAMGGGAAGGRLPAPGDDADAAAFVATCRETNASLHPALKQDDDMFDEKVLTLFAKTCAGEINPMAALFGGFVGQEVVKACSSKFTPLNQFFYFDSCESLPLDGDGMLALSKEDMAPRGTRHDGQIAVFGAKFQEHAASRNIFLVGAGALGCEFLKNLSLMGVCSTSGGGKCTVTDDTIIEKSNLSRQFLFRDKNIGSAKSTTARDAAKAINSDFSCHALQNRVSPETETVFNDAFWESLGVVVNALDNVNARLYVDSRCVYYAKPLLESGTLGMKCNTRMVLPHKTENYGASRDPPEKQAPMCTLHSFPHNIDHCLTWARNEFEGMLEKAPAEANLYLKSPSEYGANAKQAGDAQAREQLERVYESLVTVRCKTYEDCIRWARLRFQENFHNKVAQLTYTFPEDARTSNGALFWSPPKRFPTALNFDRDDATMVGLITAMAHLQAEVYGIEKPSYAFQHSEMARAISEVGVDPFVPKANVKIETDPKAAAETSMDDDARIAQLLEQVAAGLADTPMSGNLSPIVFEKDDDTNYHMDVISGLANMRARNYTIEEVDKLQAKLIAGRIVPAIATTTAAATGLVCLELYKVLLNKENIEDYRNTFCNLALPLFAMAEPVGMKMCSAARYGDLHDLVCLVERGRGDVNEWEGGYTPLLRALDSNNCNMGRGCQAEVVAWLINSGAAIPHYYRRDDLFPVSDDDWEIEHMCRELEVLVETNADVALAVLAQRLRISN
ncbi:ubiquitin-activating enzyme E1 [Pseudoscourfieldia marina]